MKNSKFSLHLKYLSQNSFQNLTPIIQTHRKTQHETTRTKTIFFAIKYYVS